MDFTSQILDVMFHLFNLRNIIYILLIIIGGLIFIRIGDKMLTKLEQKFDLNLTAHYLFKDIVKYTVIIVAIAWILHVLGINLESIIISLGVVGIVIGFASQDIVSNFISGIFVISDKRIKVGEVIEVNGFKGTIKKVGFRNTTMINQDNYEIRLRIIATLPHGMNIPEFKQELDKIMYEYDWVVNDKTSIFSKDYTEWGPKVEVSYWITDYKYIDCGKVTILENINRLIDEYKNKKNQDKI